jgi:hypothetical protein
MTTTPDATRPQHPVRSTPTARPTVPASIGHRVIAVNSWFGGVSTT